MSSQTPDLPAAWSDSPQLDGLDLVDKASLLGTPFRIMSVRFETNVRGVGFVYVDAEDVNGEPFTFNDSGSGVRAQIIDFLESTGHPAPADDTAPVAVSLVIPRGLRVSEFDVKDEMGRTKKARTYYLTTSGKRREPGAGSNGAEQAPARGRGRTRA